MQFLISGPKNRRVFINTNDENGYLRRADCCKNYGDYHYYKWALTGDFVLCEADKAEKLTNCEIKVFERDGLFYFYSGDILLFSADEKEIEEKRQISCKAFLFMLLNSLKGVASNIKSSAEN